MSEQTQHTGAFEYVCDTGDVPDEGAYACEVDDVQVAIVRSNGGLFAINNICSHAYVELSEGDVGDCQIECWLHGSRFDLQTGEPTSLPAFESVDIYPVTTDRDKILVDVTNPINKNSEGTH